MALMNRDFCDESFHRNCNHYIKSFCLYGSISKTTILKAKCKMPCEPIHLTSRVYYSIVQACRTGAFLRFVGKQKADMEWKTSVTREGTEKITEIG